ncbi:MAG: hypothetical protein GY849_00205 [Deltaproteobacteria bacterium]|nr:hypothetical protein [Deltaproteobacteria bacterium]
MKFSPTLKLHATVKDHTFRVQPVKTLIIFLTLSMTIFLAIPFQAMAGRVEVGTVTLPNTSLNPGWTTITFQQPFDTIPLVFITATSDGVQPCAVRITDVTTTDFLACQVEPTGMDGLHAAMTIHYLAVSEGVHRLGPEDFIKAYYVETMAFKHWASDQGQMGWDTLTWKVFGSTPVVLAQIQTMNNEEGTPPITPSKPWLTTVLQDLTITGGRVVLERSGVLPGSVEIPEKVGYLAFPANIQESMTDDSGATVYYESIVTQSVILGWENSPFCANQINFTNDYTSPPRVFATKITRNEGDGGWLRRCSLDKNSVGLVVDEDAFKFPKRTHIAEAVNILVFSQDFHATIPTEDVDPFCY